MSVSKARPSTAVLLSVLGLAAALYSVQSPREVDVTSLPTLRLKTQMTYKLCGSFQCLH
jgi:hypothetical protein